MNLLAFHPELYGTSHKLLDVRKLNLDVPSIMLDFTEYMGIIAENVSPYKHEDPFVPESMWCLAKSAMDNIKSEHSSPEVPRLLKENAEDIIRSRETLFDIVDQIADDEFSKKFRSLNNPIFH